MDIKKIEEQNKKVSLCLKLHCKISIALNDFNTRIAQEDAKPMLESYLGAPRHWYISERNKNEAQLLRIEKRIMAIIKGKKYDGLKKD